MPIAQGSSFCISSTTETTDTCQHAINQSNFTRNSATTRSIIRFDGTSRFTNNHLRNINQPGTSTNMELWNIAYMDSLNINRTQTTSSELVISQTPKLAEELAIAGRISDLAPPSTTKTYEPVYDQTWRLSASSSRNAPKYQISPTSLALGKAALRTTDDKKRSTTLNNYVPAKDVPSSSWKSAFAALTRSPKKVTQDAQPTYPRTSTPAYLWIRPTSSTTQTTSSDELKYDLTKPAGVVIFHHLFENDPERIRRGSQHDHKLVIDFFNELNAKVIYSHQDPKVRKVKTTMENVRKMDFGAYSCLIIVIMSHGDIKNQICALDGKYNLDDDIVDPTRANKSLRGRPKIFIVQACKGQNLIEADCNKTVPSPSDILICFSTYEGTPAFRIVDEGTYFIQTLIKMLREMPEMSIVEIMPLIRSEFRSKGIRQVPTDMSTLTKSFFFRDLKKRPHVSPTLVK
ncbi:caspase-8 [Aedes aegypti]|uniref:Uncharacterized protein n=1 Tax=Aedes aegypti TaxID=7159 RepID=A0A6I8TRD7_AEDAE|nr:caspase-8 [Aedes aegypti]